MIGGPRSKSPSLANYPACDQQVSQLSAQLWGPDAIPPPSRTVGSGLVVYDPQSPTALIADISGSRWIWFNEGNPAASAPVAARYFKKSFDIPAGLSIVSASVTMTADNSFQLAVNGQPALSGANFTVNYPADIKGLVTPGTNLLQVTATNVGTSPNPAGLIGVVKVQLSDGSTLSVVTDNSWSAAHAASGAWSAALDVGAWNASPWNKPISNQSGSSELYPSYTMTAQVLASLMPIKAPSSCSRTRWLRAPHPGLTFFPSRRSWPLPRRGRLPSILTGAAPQA